MAVRPFQFADFRAQADEIVERAREEAGRIVREARAEAESIREGARAEGIAQGREAALREERQRLAEETQRAAELIERLLREVQGRRETLAREAERDLVRLAVAIAEKIVKAEIKAKRPVAEANLRAAALLAAGRQGLVARVNPEDLKQLGTGQLGPLALKADPAIERGGCVVDLAPGEIDLQIRAQLGQIEKGLLE